MSGWLNRCKKSVGVYLRQILCLLYKNHKFNKNNYCCYIMVKQSTVIPKEKLQWTSKDSEDAKAFVEDVENGSIKTMNFGSV